MIVATIANSFIVYRVIFNWNPPSACRVDFASLEQLTFLNLEMDNAILLVKANSRYDPETICIELNGFWAETVDLHVVGDVGERRSQVKITVGLLALFIANAETVTAVPEEITPPRIDLKQTIYCRVIATNLNTHFGRSEPAILLLAQHFSTLVLDVLITSHAHRGGRANPHVSILYQLRPIKYIVDDQLI